MLLSWNSAPKVSQPHHIRSREFRSNRASLHLPCDNHTESIRVKNDSFPQSHSQLLPKAWLQTDYAEILYHQVYVLFDGQGSWQPYTIHSLVITSPAYLTCMNHLALYRGTRHGRITYRWIFANGVGGLKFGGWRLWCCFCGAVPSCVRRRAR